MFLYSNAILEKLRELTANSETPVLVTDLGDNLFRRSILGSNSSTEEIKLPLIGLSRTGWRLSRDKNYAMLKSGVSADLFEDSDDQEFSIETFKEVRDNKPAIVQAVPIEIDYQLDIVTNTLIENDMIVREFFFYFLQNPTLVVKVPYQLDFNHTVNFIIGDEVEDNSDIESKERSGFYTRQTLSFSTEGAYLWKSDYRDLIEEVEAGLYINGYKEVGELVVPDNKHF